jgi:modulator of FtsH protease
MEKYEDMLARQQQSGDGLVSVRDSGNFFGKVMLCFGLAMLLSAAGVYTGFQVLGDLVKINPNMIWLIFAIELGLVFTSRWWSTKYPLNYLLFAVFAFASGFTVVPLLASFALEFGSAIIMKALFAATFVFAATAIFGWVTQRSLSGLSGFLWVSLISMIIIAVLGIFIPWGNNFEMLYSGFGVLLFSAFTMYDMQKLKSYPSDRYIDAALNLYLDMFNLFIYLLRLIGAISRND